jgi:hypothetical protein
VGHGWKAVGGSRPPASSHHSDAAFQSVATHAGVAPDLAYTQVGWSKVFSTGILKISVVTDKREYRIYRKFIGDKNKFSEEI